MKPINTRSGEMWKVIAPEVEKHLAGRQQLTIIDLGCGHADVLSRFCQLPNARQAVGVDHDQHILRSNSKRFRQMRLHASCQFVHDQIERYICRPQLPKGFYTVGLCCSVLPYLDPAVRDNVLDWLSHSTQYTFIECQYFGDGPGPENLKNDDDMINWLYAYWDITVPIGRTLVHGRNKYRTIWMCANEAN